MRTIAPEQMNNPLTFNDLLTGNIRIYLDMDYETIFKLMIGLVLAIVVSSIITKAIV